MNNKSLKSLNKSIESCLNDQMVSNVIIAVLGVYAVLVAPNLSYEVAKSFDSLCLRLFIMLCISVICLYDPIKALLMAIGFVLSIQRLYVLKKQRKNQVSNSNVRINNTLTNNASLDVPHTEHVEEDIMNNHEMNIDSAENIANVVNIYNNHANHANHSNHNNHANHANHSNHSNHNNHSNNTDHARTGLNIPIGSLLNNKGIGPLEHFTNHQEEEQSEVVIKPSNSMDSKNVNNGINNNNSGVPVAANLVESSVKNAEVNVKQENKKFVNSKEDHELKLNGCNVPAQNLASIQNDTIPGCQNKKMKTFHNQHDIQGLNTVRGLNSRGYTSQY